MRREAESSGSKPKTDNPVRPVRKSRAKKKPDKQDSARKSAKPASSEGISSEPLSVSRANVKILPGSVSDLEFLDAVKETVYKKLLDNELDLKIDSGFKAIEIKHKISESSENERLLLEILSEIRSEEIGKTITGNRSRK